LASSLAPPAPLEGKASIGCLATYRPYNAVYRAIYRAIYRAYFVVFFVVASLRSSPATPGACLAQVYPRAHSRQAIGPFIEHVEPFKQPNIEPFKEHITPFISKYRAI
jgi:hypothetical protein